MTDLRAELLDYVVWPPGTIWPPGEPIPEGIQHAAAWGPAIASVDVDNAVIGMLKTWLPTYLRFVALNKGLSYKFAEPKESAYANTISDDQFLDHGLPAILVGTARTQGEVQRTSDGYVPTWLVATSAIVRGRTPSETRALASYYDLAIRMAMVQKPSLDGFAVETHWMSGGEVRPLADPSGQGRWLGEGASQFSVVTDPAVAFTEGPVEPNQEPYEDFPTVQVFDIEFDLAKDVDTEGDQE